MDKIGFIGLGTMGKPMALNLLKAGFPLYVNDAVQTAVDDLCGAGAIGCKHPGEIAERCDVAITMLPNAKIVDAVLNGENGFLQKARKGQIIVDMSTVASHSTKAMAELAARQGVAYVDAPVSGGAVGAKSGALTIMIGGDDEAVKKVYPLFEAMGKKIFHIGGCGMGNAMKIVNNMLFGVNMLVVAEALALAEKVGLDLHKFSEIINESSGGSYAFKAKVEPFILKRHFDAGFAVDLQHKDLGLALETGQNENTPMPMTSLAQQFYEIAKAKGLGKQDISSLVKIWEDFGQE